MSKFINKLTSYSNAAYPALHITTHEEERLLKELKASYTKESPLFIPGEEKVIYQWNCISGLFSKDPKAKVKEIKDTSDPSKLFAAIGSLVKGQANLLFVISDFHAPWKSPVKGLNLITGFKLLAPTLKVNRAMLVFVSSSSYIPPELTKDIQILDYSLPDAVAIRERLDFIVMSLNRGIAEDPASKGKAPLVLTEEIADMAVNAARGLTASEVESAFSLAIVETKEFNRDFVKSVFSEKIQQVKKTGFLTYLPSDTKFENVGGLTEIKKWVLKRKNHYSKAARSFKLPFLKGIGLAGVPGCGKTLVSKALANEFDCPLFLLDISKLFSKYVGGTEENFLEVIKIIESLGRCVILIDEVEKYLSEDATSGKSDTGASSRSFGSLLSWMSDRVGEAFIVVTSNDYLKLPDAFTRKGRFNEWFWVDLPNHEELNDIYNVVIKKYDRNIADFDMAKLVAASHGFTGAEIDSVVVDALTEAFSEHGENGKLTTELIIAQSELLFPQSKLEEAKINRTRDAVKDKLKAASAGERFVDENNPLSLRKVKV
jgi:ATP-dependent 26S proteasome regulatory subunit